MPSPALPLVSIAIPLFQSRPFLSVIIDNIETITYPQVEILVSDRHCADDTIDLLACHFTGDPRLRFLKSRDRLNWIEHYNLLLRAAAGKYFLWMPHDD